METDASTGGVVTSPDRTCRVQVFQKLRPMLSVCPWLRNGQCQYDGTGKLNGELGCAAAFSYQQSSLLVRAS